jgi:Fe-S-cluster-containing dehydrogenase component
MANEMAIFQDVDKCMRCNGCVIACKRTWGMKSETVGVQKVAYDQRLAIKSQKRVDMGPFVRFTCWHCPDPPCASACPYDAIVKRESGAVDIDETLCRPDLCRVNGQYPCVTGCQRGGYPKVGIGRFSQSAPKANKCTLCHGKAGLDVPGTAMLQTRAAKNGAGNYVSTLFPDREVPELEHEPACVSSCPAKAMFYDTKANIREYLNNSANGYVWANGTRNWLGNGSMYWGSKKVLLAPPKADPLVEDHMAPLAGSLTSGALKVALPTLVVGGLVALSTRKARIEEEALASGKEV